MKLKDLVKGVNVTENKIAHKEVPIDKLDAMLNYQRDIDMKRVEMLSSDEYFDENEVDEVKVSVREDGSMKVCDGQHTIAILKMRGWKTVSCELRYGLTIEEENDWFTVTNTKEKPQNRKRTLTSQINGTYKKNKTEQDFNNCIKALGFKLDIFGEEPGNDYKIKCPAKLLEVYKEYSFRNDVESFIECMDLIKGCWDGNSKSLQWNFIRGMFDFYETYKGDFDTKRFITSVGKKNPSTIKEIADNDKYTKKPSLKYAKIYVNEYNSGLAKNKRLKMSLLED